jgi:hypothetical protein
MLFKIKQALGHDSHLYQFIVLFHMALHRHRERKKDAGFLLSCAIDLFIFGINIYWESIFLQLSFFYPFS